MLEKCTVVLTATFKHNMRNSNEFAEYSKKSNQNGEDNGGVVLKKILVEENLGTGTKPSFVLIIEYPSKIKAYETFTNETYQNLLDLRGSIFKEVNIYI